MEPGDTHTADTLFDLPKLPGVPIGKRLTLLDSGGERAVFFGTVAICVFDRDDRLGFPPDRGGSGYAARAVTVAAAS